MAKYEQMRVNPAKSIGYSPIEAAEKIKTPMLIIEGGKDELIKPAENGQRVADILKAHGTPVEYHLFADMTHYGIYKEKFAEATKLELDWFNKCLKGEGQVSQ
jgi:dipeptidyl aminopeptidase/acylaminoacyl peptidase